MAVLNPQTGQVVQGVGGTPCYIDGTRLVSNYGAWAKWLDANTIVYVTGDANDPLNSAANKVVSYNIQNGNIEVLANHGANFLEAGGGRWCGWLGDGQTGLFGDITDPFAGVRHVGADGTIAVIPTYTDGLGVRLYAPDGRVTEGPRESMKGLRVLGPTSAMWTVDGEIRALNARVPLAQVGEAYRPKRVVVKGEEWIVYESFAGIVVHPYESTDGFRINAGQVFWMDAIAWNGGIRIAYATNEKDTPTSLIITDIDVTAGRSRLPNLGAGGNYDLRAAEKRVYLTADTTARGAATSTKSVLVAQNGLLEDEIAYRLALLATNVLQPIKTQYPRIKVVSGFRQSNSGAGQHELGEAADIQLENQTNDSLYECALWIKDHVAFDQLILNWTKMGDATPWIHVSFSPTSLRYDVLTKDFADSFHEGLGYVDDYTAEEAAAAKRVQRQMDDLVMDTLTTMQSRETRGGKTTIVTDEVTDGTEEQNIIDLPKPEYIDVVQRIKDAMWPFIQGLSDEEKAFQILIRVAYQLRGEGIGLMITPVNTRGMQIADETDDFFINWSGPRGQSGMPQGGYNISGRWLGYSNGEMYQILGPQGSFVPQWTAAPRDTTNLVSTSRWKPPIDPGDDFGNTWRAVVIGASADSTITSM